MTVAAVSNLDSNEYLLICLRISMGQTVPNGLVLACTESLHVGDN